MSDELRKLAEAATPNFDLPENLRIPLHELQADVRYLIGRVSADGSTSGMVVDAITNKLSQIETACYALTARVAALEKENARLDRLARPCLSKKARASLGEMCEAMEAMDDDTTDGTALRMLLEWHDRRAAAAMEGKK